MEAQVIRTYLEWIAELPWNNRSDDQLDLNRAALVGHSQAGAMAVELALTQPDWVTHVVVLGTVAIQLDCFVAEPVIGRRFAPTVGSSQ